MKKNTKMLKCILIGILILALVIVGAIMINKKRNTHTRPDYEPIAIIYHSEMDGVDSGIKYTYYIYKYSEINSKKYFYVKTVSNVTIEGTTAEKEVDSGNLNKKKDLQKIKKDIEKDTKDNKEQYFSYSYSKSEEVPTSLEELGKNLF